ncbi:MAG: dihydrolipoamide acetyltransferase family protein [Parvibaculum sp.]
MYEFKMPSLGADMEAGTLVEWLKKPGEAIKRGDIIAVVETEKGAIEVEVFETGTLTRQLVEEGTTVPVGTPLALIETGKREETTSPEAPSPPVAVESPARQAIKPPRAEQPSSPAAAATVTRVKASPAARAYAREHEIDLSTVSPKKLGGAILRSDVETASAQPSTAERPRRTTPGLDLDKMRHAIAAAMTRSKQEIPHYYLNTEINLHCATEWLSDTNAARKPETRLLMNVLLVKATAKALENHPKFNGLYADGTFTAAEGIHIGMAIAIRGGGLVAPAIHDCDKKSLNEIMDALRDLVARVRVGSIRSSEMSDPTITVTSLGERGVDSMFGVIYPPQVAIIGFGAPRLRPIAHQDGALAAEPVITASLAADHRVTDGRLGARFLSEIDKILQEPETL